MKNRKFDIAVFIFFFILSMILFSMKISLWQIAKIYGVILIVIFVVIFFYQMRSGLTRLIDAHDVEPGTVNDQLMALINKSPPVEELNFIKEDEYYHKSTPETWVYQFRNLDGMTYLLLLAIPKMTYIYVISLHEDDYSITTSNFIDTGNNPPLDKSLRQIFSRADLQTLLKRHVEAVKFMKSRNYEQVPLPDEFENFRAFNVHSNRKNIENILKDPFWLPRLFYRILTGYGKRYACSIEEQHKRGVINVPERKQESSNESSSSES